MAQDTTTTDVDFFREFDLTLHFFELKFLNTEVYLQNTGGKPLEQQH